MSLQSTVGLAKTKPAKSLRTTIPQGIAIFLQLKLGDKLDWVMETNQGGVRFVTVTRAKRFAKGGE